MRIDWKNTSFKVRQYGYCPTVDKLFVNTNVILLDFVSACVDEIIARQVFEIEFAVSESILSARRDWN